MKLIWTLLIASALMLSAQQPPAATPTAATVNAFLERMYGFDPELKWKVTTVRPSSVPGITEVVYYLGADPRATHLFITSDGQHAIAGQMIPFGTDPFAAERATLSKGMNGFSKGPADAKVSLVVFSDLQCPHCKAAEPIVEKLQQDVAGARLVFQQFPLVNIHPWAMTAAKYSDCVGRSNPDQGFKFNDAVFSQQDSITQETAAEKFGAILSAAGVDASKIARCAAEPATEQRVQQSIALGASLGVDSTPTVFINGRKLVGFAEIPYETLKSLVEWEEKQAK